MGAQRHTDLNLAGVEVHGDDVVRPGDGEHVGHQLGADGGPALVLLVLPGVGKGGYDGRHPLRRGDLAGVDHDEQLHEVVVDLAPARLHDVHVLAADALPDLDARLEVAELFRDDLAGLDAEPVADLARQVGVGAPREDLDVGHPLPELAAGPVGLDFLLAPARLDCPLLLLLLLLPPLLLALLANALLLLLCRGGRLCSGALDLPLDPGPRAWPSFRGSSRGASQSRGLRLFWSFRSWPATHQRTSWCDVGKLSTKHSQSPLSLSLSLSRPSQDHGDRGPTARKQTACYRTFK